MGSVLVVADLFGANRVFLEGYGLKLTRRVNGACSFAFSAGTDDPNARELLIGKRSILLYRDGALRFRGILGEPFVDEADWVRCTAYDPFYFTNPMPVGNGSLSPTVFTNSDAGAIAWSLISALAYETHLREGTIQPSALRDRSYEPGKSVGEAITQLAGVDDGFFFRIDPRESSDAGMATFNVLYPTAGVDRPDVRFEYGDKTLGNIDAEGLEVERFMPVNAVTAVGAGEADLLPVAVASDSASQAEYGTRPKWVSFPDVTEAATLAEHARQEVHPQPLAAARFSALETAPRLFDDFDVGDTVRALVDNGRMRFEGVVRVNQVTLEIDDSTGAERLTGLVLESPTAQPQETV